ncbi:DUF421 domain-containing protein [Paenibacillus sp. 481]|uniref:DUF421 domain-containing protein n=1 Tax=Paenibacillus sp. 481 TaxID=2835869 RepID=UPI001E560205|nr:DUF421 domain-containing protein [Paenibacillus sp. 481]UHA73573.1 DUF421 domain-containing protein [Paenibacillus sp. 481]
MQNVLEVILRTLTAVVVLFFITKMLGKRQISQLSLFEYITGITIGSLAAYVSLDLESNWYLGILSLAVWALVSLGIEFAQLKSKKLRDGIDGTGTVLIKEGKILEDNLKKERLTLDELMEQLRSKQVFALADVEFATMEVNGQVNVLLKKENLPVTAKMLGLSVLAESEPQTVISDGNIMNEPLAAAGYTREWLKAELNQLSLTPEQVYAAQVDSNGQLFVDLYKDSISPTNPSQHMQLLAALKKCTTELEQLTGTAKTKQDRKKVEQCTKSLKEAIAKVGPLLQT